MVVKKFYAQSTRDALRQVREDLGADALILSNRPTLGGGVEIMAVADSEFASMATNLSGSPHSKNPPRQTSQSLTSTPAARALERAYQQPSHLDTLQETIPLKEERLHSFSEHANKAFRSGNLAATPDASVLTQEKINNPLQLQEAHTEMLQSIQQMRQELQQLRSSMDRHESGRYQEVSNLSSNMDRQQSNYLHEIERLKEFIQQQQERYHRDAQLHQLDSERTMLGYTPQHAEVINVLIPAGFSAALMHKLMQKLPQQYAGQLAVKWVKSALIHNLKCPLPQEEPMEQPGIYAVVGPTGSGKTSMVVKLAARAAHRQGAMHVALVSMDTQKLGNTEQLKLSGKILGIETYFVQNTEELKNLLDPLRSNYKVIIIDTPGMSQKDGRVVQQSKMFATFGYEIKQLLVLPATSSGIVLDECTRQFYTKHIHASIVTKIDEATHIGAVLDVIIRHRLPLWYMSNGQRTPKDIHLASASFLIDRAMRQIDHGSVFNPLHMLPSNKKNEENNNLLVIHETHS